MNSATDLVPALLKAAQPFPPEQNPIVLRLQNGELDRAALRPFAAMVVSTAEHFPLSICKLLGVCREGRVRESLIGNLLEEEGVVTNGNGPHVTISKEKSHGGLARRFARASGLTDAELDSVVPVENAWFDEQLRQGKWLGPFAYFAVGFEANVPATFRLIASALQERWGFSDEELVFFTEHVTADDRHGIESAELISALATDDAARAEALEGARRGGLAFWHLHRRTARNAS